jgi:transcription elongation factor Elf1
MPLYNFSCPVCGKATRRILVPEDLDYTEVRCAKCDTIMEYSPKPPTTRITETLDNGAMVKKVERLSDAEEIYRDRAHGKKGVI